jgi:hypothetical protein
MGCNGGFFGGNNCCWMSKRGENIYKRKDGRWEGRILKADGKYAYIYGKSYREVKEKKKKAPSETVNGKQYSMAQSNASALFQNWLNNQANGRIRRSTYDSYHCCIHKYIIPFFRAGDDRLSETRIKEFVQTIAFNQKISTSYQRKIINVFKSSIRAIAQEKEWPLAFLNNLWIPQKANTPAEVFTPHEQILIERAIISSQDFRVCKMS